MSDRIYVGTRKGLFTVTRNGGGWAVLKVDFLGDPVTQHLHDPRGGTLSAVPTTAHFGAKLRRSDDGGTTWEECAVPIYPAGAMFPAREGPPTPASLSDICALVP